MKKKIKIISAVVVGVSLLAGASVGIYFSIDNSNNSVSGTLVEGTGNEDWRRYTVDIPYKTLCSDVFYTNEPGDYITDISFDYTDGRGTVEVSYNNWFNFFDDFEAVFVFSNMKTGSEEVRYTTDVSVSHWAGVDAICFDPVHLDSHFYDENFVWTRDTSVIKAFHIVELWCRTDL